MLFFSREEFVEEPLKDILDSFQVKKSDPKSYYSYLHNKRSSKKIPMSIVMFAVSGMSLFS